LLPLEHGAVDRFKLVRIVEEPDGDGMTTFPHRGLGDQVGERGGHGGDGDRFRELHRLAARRAHGPFPTVFVL